jgi:hypothetical protein
LKVPELFSRIGRFLGGLSTERLASPAPGRARSRTNLFVGVYLFVQIVLPFSYYMRADKSDERFAWRMFSAVKYLQQTCIVSLGEWRPGGKLRPLPRDEFISKVPYGWMQFLHRDRDAVIGKFLNRYCAANPDVVELELLRKCAAPDGRSDSLESLKMDCRTGALRRAQGFP